MQPWPSDLENRVDEIIQQTLRDSFTVEENGQYYLAPLGNLVLRRGLSFSSATHLYEYFQEQSSRPLYLPDVLFLSCLAHEIRDLYVSVSHAEIATHGWSRLMLEKAGDACAAPHTLLHALLSSPGRLTRHHHEAMKKALLLRDWMDMVSIQTLEQRFRVYAGTIHRLAEDAAWIVACLADIAAAHAMEGDWTAPLNVLEVRLEWGLSEAALAWVPWLRRQQMSRVHVLALQKEGYPEPRTLRTAKREHLESFLPAPVVQALLQHDPETIETPAEDFRFRLALDPSHPHHVRINDQPVVLTPQQSQLVHHLARQPNRCISYNTLLKNLWGEGLGDRKALSRLKRCIQLKVNHAVGEQRKELIETVEGRGMILRAMLS